LDGEQVGSASGKSGKEAVRADARTRIAQVCSEGFKRKKVMAYERKFGDIAIFKNDKKGNEKAPDYRGNGLDLDGNEIEVAMWVKDMKNGGKFLAGKIQSPYKKQDQDPLANKNAEPVEGKFPSKFEDMDDDLPF
jgi:uncharacterized protein (DUF736 family)